MRLASAVSLITCLCMACPVVGGDNPPVLELWPGKVPDETGDRGAERTLMSPQLDRKQVEVTESTKMITNVSKPTITIYRPVKDKDTGTAIIICPGGGYWNLYWQLEGEEVAAWLNSLGITGTILKYRVPRASTRRTISCFSGSGGSFRRETAGPIMLDSPRDPGTGCCRCGCRG
jgi:hypothetical protein